MNNRASALVFSFLVVTVLSILGSAVVMRSASEKKISQGYADSAQAFWIAEAGLAQAYYNWSNGISQPQGAVSYGGGTYSIDASSLVQTRVTGVFGASSRILQGSFVFIPRPFDNTLSAGGNLRLSGLLARVEIYDKTRISGTYSRSFGASGWFEDKQENVDQNLTTIKIPDYSGNGVSDEFSDFVLFGRNAAQSYPEDQVVYIQTDNTVNIFPNQDLVGKKIIYVEGTQAGAGDVNIFFDTTWHAGEDLTVISTGDITYVEPLQFQADARLSTISWVDYNEASVFRSEHESIIYTHDDANFVDILDWGSTTGSVIANDEVSLNEVLTYEKYYYSDRIANGDLSPGFKWLSTTNNGTRKMMDWQEIRD
ncbi:MAG: pilus assembly PilX N-terminal domain-containing protein [Candidatus Omnitrophica bacterium]|nr:pilus assembly PilX N-terminal domain-containing protein [Candidatus Omnitrophota bacterium]